MTCFLYGAVTDVQPRVDRVLGYGPAVHPTITVTALTSTRPNADSAGPFEIAVCASHVDCHEDDVRPAAVRRGRGRRLVLQHPLAGSWSPHSAALENPDQDDFHLDSA